MMSHCYFCIFTLIVVSVTTVSSDVTLKIFLFLLYQIQEVQKNSGSEYLFLLIFARSRTE
jgi:hypothetical protein